MKLNKIISEQANQVNEQATQIKSMAQGMLENGMPLEMVAKMMNRTPEEVRALFGKSCSHSWSMLP